MAKLVSIEEAINYIEDGMTIMVGGFLGCGTPSQISRCISRERGGKKNLTLICNDSGFEDFGVGKLVVNKQIKKNL